MTLVTIRATHFGRQRTHIYPYSSLATHWSISRPTKLKHVTTIWQIHSHYSEHFHGMHSKLQIAQQVADGSFAWDHMRYCLAPSVNDNLCSEHQQFTIGCHEAWTDPVQLQLQHCSRQFLTCTWFITNQYNMGSHNSTPPKPSHRSY